LEIAWLDVLVKVPRKKTTWLLLRVPPESATAEMFIPVMFTVSPSAAWDGEIGRARSPKLSAATASTDVEREYPS
jgi:hypothetical protein